MSRAEDLHSAKRNEFTFQWTITNLGMFGDIPEKTLSSPKFVVLAMDHSEWFLKLVFSEDRKSASCFLHRTDTGPDSVNISYSFTVGSSFSVERQRFGRNTSSTMSATINLCEMLDPFFLKDVLIECQLWQSDNRVIVTREAPESPYPVLCSARTLIPCEQRSFYFPVSSFRDLINCLIKSIRVCSGGGGTDLNFSFELRKVSYTTKGKKFQLKFLKSNPECSSPFFLKSRIQLVDALKRRHTLIGGQLGHWSDLNSSSNETTFLVPTSMLEKRDLYFPGDTMLLFCEFAIFDNQFRSYVESTRYDCSGFPATKVVCGWGLYLDQMYKEHRFVFRLLAVFVLIFSLILPHLFAESSL